MTAPLRLALVGCGDVAGFVALFARLNRGVTLSACCDLQAERAAAFARRHRIAQQYVDYEVMLAAGGFDAVYLAVPHDLHHQMIGQALAAGYPVWVEKPITRTLAQGQQMVAMAQTHNLPLGVNYQYRYDAGCYPLARALQARELGRIYTVNCTLAWGRDRRYFQRAPWHASLARAGGGTLITQGSHLLDVALWALGEPAVAATAVTGRRKFEDVEVEDVAQGTLELAGGTLLQINSQMVGVTDEPLRIDVYGEQGSAHYRNRPWPRVSFRGVRPPRHRPPRYGLLRGAHALARSLEGFRAWVQEGEPYLIPGREALPALAAVEALYRAARSGRRVEITDWPTGSPIAEEEGPHDNSR